MSQPDSKNIPYFQQVNTRASNLSYQVRIPAFIERIGSLHSFCQLAVCSWDDAKDECYSLTIENGVFDCPDEYRGAKEHVFVPSREISSANIQALLGFFNDSHHRLL